MRIAVVYFNGSSEKVSKLAKKIANGIEGQGHQITMVNGLVDTNIKLTIFDYIVVGTSPLSFFSGKISEKVGTFLKNAGTLTGIKSYAFVCKNGFFTSKALQTLMKTMEKEGMFLKISDIISSGDEALAIGKRLKIS